jgi:hypothetical protein
VIEVALSWIGCRTIVHNPGHIRERKLLKLRKVSCNDKLLSAHSWDASEIISRHQPREDGTVCTVVWASPSTDVMAIAERKIPFLLQYYGANPMPFPQDLDSE